MNTEEKYEIAIEELSKKCAEFIMKNGTNNLIDIEEFIVALILKFNIDYYQVIGILEESKNSYRDMVFSYMEDKE